MKKEHLEKLKETSYTEKAFTLYLLNHIVDIDLVSDTLIQEKEINQYLKKIGKILKELSQMSDEKESIINSIIKQEEQKHSDKSKTYRKNK